MDQIDLATYGGISFAVVALVGASKKLFKSWVDGKEPMLALVLTLALGISAKLFGVFSGPNDAKTWLAHVVALFLAAAGAGVIHDKVTNVFAGKEDKPK